MFAAANFSAFQILQAEESDNLLPARDFVFFVVGDNGRAAEITAVADEFVAGFVRDEPIEVVQPGIGDTGAVGND